MMASLERASIIMAVTQNMHVALCHQPLAVCVALVIIRSTRLVLSQTFFFPMHVQPAFICGRDEMRASDALLNKERKSGGADGGRESETSSGACQTINVMV